MNQPRNNHDFNPYESAQQTTPQGEQPETPAGATQAHGSQAGGNAGMSPNDPAHSAASQNPQPDTAASPVQAPTLPPSRKPLSSLPDTPPPRKHPMRNLPMAPLSRPQTPMRPPRRNLRRSGLGCFWAARWRFSWGLADASDSPRWAWWPIRFTAAQMACIRSISTTCRTATTPTTCLIAIITAALSDIKEAAGDLPCDIDDEGKAAPGVYVVGRDIDEGLYFLQGNPSTESECYLFDPEGFGTYNMDAAVTYTGNYFADLEDGQVVVFMPSSASMLMIPADQADFQPQAPYASGLYRVGQDIPAGTYTITVSPDAPRNASQDYAAYVMKDLDFDDDSITDSKPLLRGSTQTITVEDGEWLELFGTIATPAE